MMRLRNNQTGVQILMSDAKAAHRVVDGRYTAPDGGVYEAVPDGEQPPKDDPAPQVRAKAKGTPGPTSIAAALKASAGPMWDTAI